MAVIVLETCKNQDLALPLQTTYFRMEDAVSSTMETVCRCKKTIWLQEPHNCLHTAEED